MGEGGATRKNPHPAGPADCDSDRVCVYAGVDSVIAVRTSEVVSMVTSVESLSIKVQCCGSFPHGESSSRHHHRQLSDEDAAGTANQESRLCLSLSPQYV